LRTSLPLAATAVAWSGCAQPAHSEPAAADVKQAAVPVTVSPVVVRQAERLVNFVGTLYGNEEVTLSSQVEGQINSLHADLGDQVEAGQVVAQINDDQLRARLREAEATLAKAQADEARGRQLEAGHIISTQEYESMKTQAAVAQAQRDTLTVTIRHAHVESPIRGAVARRFVSAGEYVHPGSQLFSLVAEDPLKLRGDVPERFAHELQAGQPVQVRVDGFPQTLFVGRLARISPASNPENRSVSIEAVVDNHERKLKPGFFANAAVVTRSDDQALMVPQEALITFAGVTKLFVISDGTAHERQVHTGSRGGGGLIEIIDGIAPDDVVATSGLTKLENGIAVSVKGQTNGQPSKEPAS
jgi:membrane fusion protein, multidrug efflux system